MRSTDPKGRLAVIGGDPRWQRRLFRLAEQAGLVPEIMSWAEALWIEAPVSGIVVHVAAADGVLDAFRTWAPMGFHSVSIVSLVSSPCAAEHKAELKAVGFERILLARPWVRAEGRYWSEVGAHVAGLAAPNLALVPIVMGMLGRSDIGLVRLVAAVLQKIESDPNTGLECDGIETAYRGGCGGGELDNRVERGSQDTDRGWRGCGGG